MSRRPPPGGVAPHPGARRVPGLRREEVAQLAGVGVDYCIRLERGRTQGVSQAVLEAVARALEGDPEQTLVVYTPEPASPPPGHRLPGRLDEHVHHRAAGPRGDAQAGRLTPRSGSGGLDLGTEPCGRQDDVEQGVERGGVMADIDVHGDADGGTWNWRGGRIREAFLEAAGTVAGLLAEPAVAAAWDKPSALPDFGVGGLAGHLAWQELALPELLAEPEPGEPVVSLREYYLERVTWLDAGVDGAVNVRIRRGGDATAADGHEVLVARVRETVARLREELPTVRAGRPIRVRSWGDWSLDLDDFLLTRLLELVVHADDLAYSVGLPTPDFPERVTAPVVELLARLAVRRHGTVEVIRGLARTERAPASIAGL
ncbi:maleylpyruvate isomerase N-terminal domain-containing protein [Streptomyces sp. NPDC058255]|uniref:maleylpyruvate isomerase N-terminal domain-containing protein n=1 Tax=Streptomyces sp. NPDC058255 TaxID=3346407 RepID=UPI0036E30EE9